MFNMKRLGVVLAIVIALVLAACGGDDNNNNNNNDNNDNNNNTEVNNNDNNNSNDGAAAGEYGEEVNFEIVGIEPGAGVVKAAEQTVEDYENMEGWEVVTSSSGAMATALGEAIENEEPIIVTGWSPHWKFEAYDLKYLEDPKGVFGEAETIETMAREGLEEDLPNAFKMLEQFEWPTEDMEAVMLEISEGASPEEAAADYVADNADKVDEWTDGVEESDGEEIELVYVEWDTEVASTHVVGEVLSNLGFDVTLTPLDNAVMWEAIATGQADAMVAAWLPGTHGDLYEEHKDDIVELGVNLEGAKIGLVVPEYMDIDSIEDLAPAN